MRKRINILLLPVLLTLILCNSSNPLYSGFRSGRDVTWFGRYAFILIKYKKWKRIRRKYHIRRSQYKYIKRIRQRYLYRIPRYMVRYSRIKKHIYKGRIPFYYIDSDIFRRRKSYSPKVWDSGYKDFTIVKKYLRYLHKKYPAYTRLIRIGRSVKKRPIYALKISANAGKREAESSFLFDGVHHGNEPLSADYVLSLAKEILWALDPPPPPVPWYDVFGKIKELRQKYKRAEYKSYIKRYALWFIPVINPDGFHNYWYKNAYEGRKNGRRTLRRRSRRGFLNGVDLNRNYPFMWHSGLKNASSSKPWMYHYRGKSPASEPETKAMIRLAEREKFVLSLSFHCYATKVLIPYTIDGLKNPEPDVVRSFGKKLAEAGISNRPDKDYIAVKNLYKVDGTDQDWLFHRFGTLAFIVEGSFLSPVYRTYGKKSVQGMLPLSLKAISLYDNATTLVVYTKDEFHQPLSAKVRILEQNYYEGEVFRTDKTFGRKEFVLADSGTYTVFAESKDGRKAEKKIYCGSGHCKVTIFLTEDKSYENSSENPEDELPSE